MKLFKKNIYFFLAIALISVQGAYALEASGSCTIITSGGTGNAAGFGGDGGPATAVGAKMNQPDAIIQDGSGNFYIADSSNNRVRKISSGGTLSTVAGNGISGYNGDNITATTAELQHPIGVAVYGNLLYISDQSNQRIRQVNLTTGIITTVAGTGTSGYSGDGGPATSAKLAGPARIAVDGSGNLYIADVNNQVIREVNASTGIITTVAGSPQSAGYSGDGGPAVTAQLDTPQGVFVDGQGDIYVADTNNNRIREVNAVTGYITTVVGNGTAGTPTGANGDGGAAAAAQLNRPVGVAVNPACGDMFISDTLDQKIREVSGNTGVITTISGTGVFGFSGDGGPASSAQLDVPSGICVDTSGNLFIADQNSQCIREVKACAACSPNTPTITPTPTATRNCSTVSITSAAFYTVADDQDQIYINGNFLGTSTLCGGYSSYNCPTTFTVPVGWLNMNACNLIAATDFDLHGGDIGLSYDLVIQFSDGSVQEISSDPNKWTIQYYYAGINNGANPPVAPSYPPADGSGNQWYQTNFIPCSGWNPAVLIGTKCYGGWVYLNYQVPCGIGCGNVPWMSSSGCNPITPNRTDSFRQLFSICSNVSCPVPACVSPTATPTPTSTPTFATPTNTPTNTPTSTPTLTPSPTPSSTPTVTPTFTVSPTPTSTPPPAPTFTPTCVPQVWPNPFNPKYAKDHFLKIGCLGPGSTVTFYTLSGEKVWSTSDSATQYGDPFTAVWDGTNQNGVPVSAGIYFYVIQNSGSTLLRGKILIYR